MEKFVQNVVLACVAVLAVAAVIWLIALMF